MTVPSIVLTLFDFLMSIEASVIANRISAKDLEKARKIATQLEQQVAQAQSGLSLKDLLMRCCDAAAQVRRSLPIPPTEDALWQLLDDGPFRNEMADALLGPQSNRDELLVSLIMAELQRVTKKPLTDDIESLVRQFIGAIRISIAGNAVVSNLVFDMRLGRIEEGQQEFLQETAGNRDLLARGISGLQRGMAELDQRVVSAVRERGGVVHVVSYDATVVSTAVPMSTQYISRREKVVDAVARLARSHVWSVIYGPPFTGKTHIAILCCGQFCSKIWVDLRGLSSEGACFRLDNTIAHLVEREAGRDWRAVYDEGLRQLPEGSLIVIDDLSDSLDRGRPLTDRMLAIAGVALDRGLHILAVSPEAAPQNMLEVLGATSIQSMEVPPLSNEEAGEILQQYGAPQQYLRPQVIAFINGASLQNPALCSAASSFLASRKWPRDYNVLKEIMLGQHRARIDEELRRRLVGAIEDAHTRDLFYRLLLIMSDFTLDDVLAVASILPEIPFASEKLSALVGPWIQRAGHGKYLVHPILRPIAAGNLSNVTLQGCMETLGRRLVGKGKLNAEKAFEILCYFMGAGKFNDAAVLFISFLMGYTSQKAAVSDYGALLFWRDMPIPEEVALSQRLLIRSLQLVAFKKQGASTAYTLSDLKSLLIRVGPQDGACAFIAAMKAASALTDTAPVDAGDLLLIAAKHVDTAVMPSGEKISVPRLLNPESLILLLPASIHSAVDLRAWARLLEGLPEVSARMARWHRVGSALSLPLMSEKEKPKAEQQWAELLAAYEAASHQLLRLGLTSAWAFAIRAQISIIMDEFKDLDRAVATGGDAVKVAPDEPSARFLLKEVVGRQYAYANKWPEARKWLDHALAEPVVGYATVKLDALVFASAAVGNDDPTGALDYVERAASLSGLRPIARVRALAELCLARHLAGLPSEAVFSATDRAWEILLGHRNDSDEWKDLFVMLGHLTGYLREATARVAGAVPLTEFATPRRCLFLGFDKRRAALYQAVNEGKVLTMLVVYANSVGATTSVEKWARRGVEAAIRGDASVAVVVLPYSMPWLLREARYGDVMRIARVAGAAFAEHSRLGGGTTTALGGDGQGGDAAWGDRFAVGTGVLCAVVHLGLLLETGSAIEVRVNSLIALCDDSASSGGDRTLWENVACLLHEIFEGDARYGGLIAKYKTYDACGEANLALIALVGTTLRPDVPLKDAAKCHSIAYEYIARNKSMYDYVYGEILVPFLEQYWHRAFADNRAHFASPNLVEQELADAGRSSADVRAQKVLSIILRGLGIRISGGVGEWLRT